MRSILTWVCTLVCMHFYAQTTIEFRILNVSSNIGDMDGAFQGDSDPHWEAEILDGSSIGSFSEDITANCPGVRSLNRGMGSRAYNCALPANFTFRWRAYEDDGWLGTDANTGQQTILVPAGGLTATSFTTIAEYTATVSGDRCGGGNTVTWGITLQYRVSGNFLLNTPPSSVNASATLVQTGHNVTLTQVGGTTTLGSANYTWTTGSCNGPVVGTGPTITPTVNAPTTYFVKSVGLCSTTCAAVFINSSALGVTLSDYHYVCSDDAMEFYWQTESESNNSHFIIEQMLAPDEWKPVAKIAGHGTTSISKRYEYKLPASAANNNRYYRLVQVDKDGKQTVYDPFYASCQATSKALTIYPNPNHGSWSVYPFEKDLQIRSVRNQAGKLVPFEQNNGTIQLINSEAGTYFVELISNGQTDIQKVVVE